MTDQTNAPPREPTEAMEMAGWRVVQHYADADSPPTAAQVWRAMYDAWVPPTPAPADALRVAAQPFNKLDQEYLYSLPDQTLVRIECTAGELKALRDALTEAPQITLFLCGPSKCEHDYAKYEPIVDLETGKVVGGTAVCVKCGTTAIEEATWE
jgi:hypothetical protein